jgi:hypothetical protein
MSRAFFYCLLLNTATVLALCGPEDVAKWNVPGFNTAVVEFSTKTTTVKALIQMSVSKNEAEAVSKITDKATKQLGLSEACAGCLASNIVCAFKYCSLDCMADPNGAAGRACNDLHCTPDFRNCVGHEAAETILPGLIDTSSAPPTESRDEN